tara:strand:+ start:1234 stop:1488 length:255 start_codon:yes stop_codon:yes gene_type:complete
MLDTLEASRIARNADGIKLIPVNPKMELDAVTELTPISNSTKNPMTPNANPVGPQMMNKNLAIFRSGVVPETGSYVTVSNGATL